MKCCNCIKYEHNAFDKQMAFLLVIYIVEKASPSPFVQPFEGVRSMHRNQRKWPKDSARLYPDSEYKFIGAPIYKIIMCPLTASCAKRSEMFTNYLDLFKFISILLPSNCADLNFYGEFTVVHLIIIHLLRPTKSPFFLPRDNEFVICSFHIQALFTINVFTFGQLPLLY